MKSITDHFEKGIAPEWVRFCIGHGSIENVEGIARLALEGAEEGKLSDAEIDDHRTVPRTHLLWKPPVRATVRARFSHPSERFLGTAGFGFWNDPFDWVGNVQVPPNALWFFYASPPTDMSFLSGVRGNGWKAAMLNGGRSNAVELAIGNLFFRIPYLSKFVFALADLRIKAAERLLDEIEMTEWHTYELDWREPEAIFAVDGREVMRASNPPRMALGFVAWVDNNCTTMGPGREVSFGRMAIGQREWMELDYVKIDLLGGSGQPTVDEGGNKE